MTSDAFETLVIEKLTVIERRITGLEVQMNILVNAFAHHSQHLAEIDATCVRNHAGTPNPRLVKE